MTGRLKDKVALVFGAGSVGPGWGNGKATAVLFAREGARVVAVDRNEAAARETAEIITGEGGVSQFAVARALQHATDGIRANAIMPGLMDTPMIHQQAVDHYGGDAAMVAKRNAQCPMGFMGSGWDVAHAALFLASDEARY